jgi:hypothetical protein
MEARTVSVRHPPRFIERLRRAGWFALWLLAKRTLDMWLSAEVSQHRRQ